MTIALSDASPCQKQGSGVRQKVRRSCALADKLKVNALPSPNCKASSPGGCQGTVKTISSEADK